MSQHKPGTANALTGDRANAKAPDAGASSTDSSDFAHEAGQRILQGFALSTFAAKLVGQASK
jgi:hypothetical protein